MKSLLFTQNLDIHGAPRSGGVCISNLLLLIAFLLFIPQIGYSATEDLILAESVKQTEILEQLYILLFVFQGFIIVALGLIWGHQR